jgi:hypothetical protein
MVHRVLVLDLCFGVISEMQMGSKRVSPFSSFVFLL